MKKILNFLAIIALSFATVQVVMADGNTPKLPQKTERLDKQIASNNGSPRTLGDLFITCHYNNECIELEFPADVDFMEVTIGNENTTIWSGVVTADMPSCDIPYLVGDYVIACTTDNGTVYSGLLSF